MQISRRALEDSSPVTMAPVLSYSSSVMEFQTVQTAPTNTDVVSVSFYRAMLRRARLCQGMMSVCLSVCQSVTFRYADHRRRHHHHHQSIACTRVVRIATNQPPP